ncbi:MAG: hypothetical protein H0T73_00545, partial [Ardenticatenales bacterium]|nr:hypothetical protein [Ardenticatenales bacterium]
YQTLGRFDESYTYVGRCLDIAREIGQKYLEGCALFARGWAEVNQGQTAQGIKTLTASEALCQAIGAEYFVFQSAMRKAEARLSTFPGDKINQAPEWIQTLKNHPDGPDHEGDILRLEAMLARHHERLVEALEAIDKSLAKIDQQREPFLYLLSDVERILILRQMGQDVTNEQGQALIRWQRVAQVNTLPPPSISSKLFSIIG